MKKDTEDLIELIKEDLRGMMSEHRFNHSVSVMNKAVELAEIYGENVDEAALAGLTHDIAKEIPDEEAFRIADENGIELDEIERINTKLLHGKIGAFVAKKKYGFNEKILNAIRLHTETASDMDMLAKIVFVADKIEDMRKSDKIDIEEQRRLASFDIDGAIIMIIDNTIKKLLDRGKLIHPDEILTRNELLRRRKKK